MGGAACEGVRTAGARARACLVRGAHPCFVSTNRACCTWRVVARGRVDGACEPVPAAPAAPAAQAFPAHGASPPGHGRALLHRSRAGGSGQPQRPAGAHMLSSARAQRALDRHMPAPRAAHASGGRLLRRCGKCAPLATCKGFPIRLASVLAPSLPLRTCCPSCRA